MTSTRSTSPRRLSPAVRGLGVVVAASLSLTMGGCAKGKSAAHTSAATDSAGSQSSSKGLFDPQKLISKTDPGTEEVKSVRWGLRTGEPSTLDPAKTGSDSDYIVSGNLCESLYTVDEMFGLQPNLADEVEWKDPKTLEITLRNDVTFWNGTPLTAKDVVASLKRTADPKSGSIYAGYFALLKDAQAIDDTHVRVTFTAHDADFIDVMASPAGRIMQADSIQTIGKDLGTPKGGVMCTGPYKLKKWTPGQDVTIESNPGYWGGEPQVKTVTFVPTQDDANLTSALMAGDLDGAFDIPQASTKQLTASGKGKVYIGPSNFTISLGPVTSKGPAADPRVRRALSLAVDRNAMIRSILRGYGAPASTFTVPFQFQGLEQADTFQAAYDKLGSPDVDLKRAKALIKEAGAKDKTLTVLVPSGNQMLLNLATVVKDDAAKVGLKLKIQQRSASEYARFFYSEEAREGVDLIVAVGYQDTPGVNTYATQNAVPGEEGLFNWSKYDNKDVTRLLRSAKSANTTADAAKDFVAAQKIFAPDQLQVTLGVQYARTFMRKGLSGTVTSIAYINTPWAKDLGGTAG